MDDWEPWRKLSEELPCVGDFVRYSSRCALCDKGETGTSFVLAVNSWPMNTMQLERPSVLCVAWDTYWTRPKPREFEADLASKRKVEDA